MSQSEAMIVRNADVQALVGSKYYTTRKNGIEFATDNKGELVPIPKDDFFGEHGLVDTLDRFNQAWGWWVGDTGCAIEALFGEAELAKFFQKIHFDPGQGKKYMSTSRTYGWPNKIAELRHPDPQVSHSHHQLAAGIKDLKQRMNLLNKASKQKLNSAQFYDEIQKFKAGPGADDGADASIGSAEYPVFRPRFRAFDQKMDNQEQYLQEFFNHVKERDFPAYLDPAIAAKFKAEEDERKAAEKASAARLKMVEGIIEPRRTELLDQLASGALSEEAFKDAVKAEKDKTNIGDRIKTLGAKLIKNNDPERDRLVAEAVTEGLDLDGFKAKVKAWKDEQRKRSGEVKTIEKAAEKIKDETKRQTLIDKVHAENLTFEQFEPLVKEILTEQFVQEESDRIAAENKKKLEAATDPSKISEKVERMFSKPAKATSAVGAPGLQKNASKKKGAARSKKAKK